MVNSVISVISVMLAYGLFIYISEITEEKLCFYKCEVNQLFTLLITNENT